MTKENMVPTVSKILSVVNFLAGLFFIYLAISSNFDFITLGIIVFVIVFIFVAGWGLWRRERWAYFFEIMIVVSGIGWVVIKQVFEFWIGAIVILILFGILVTMLTNSRMRIFYFGGNYSFGHILRCFNVFFKDDNWISLMGVVFLAINSIVLIFFPIVSLLTGTALPLVIVESCSMHHQEEGFARIFNRNNIYEEQGISLDDTKTWVFQNGFNKGDIIFVWRPKNIEVGDVIIFNAGQQFPYPIIHRVIRAGDTYGTVGDNNMAQHPTEREIEKEQIIGKALFRIPHVGWVKLIFFEHLREPIHRGFC
jgi:hypothetical protein